MAPYLTNNMQELVTPSSGNISLQFGGDQNGHEVQQLSIKRHHEHRIEHPTTRCSARHCGSFQLSLPNPSNSATPYQTPTINYDEILFGVRASRPRRCSAALGDPNNPVPGVPTGRSPCRPIGAVVDFPTPSARAPSRYGSARSTCSPPASKARARTGAGHMECHARRGWHHGDGAQRGRRGHRGGDHDIVEPTH